MTSPESDTVAVVAGRRVRVVRGRRSQTVNVCTSANVIGEYEITYRLRPEVDVTTVGLTELADLEALKAWVLARDGVPESPDGRSTGRVIPRVAAPPLDDPWVVRARGAVERAITNVVHAFTEAPYLHRVEHSLHTQLSEALRAEPELAETHTLRTGEQTQLIHKEWPETIPEQAGADAAPRGKFDLAVLAPAQIGAATLDQFRAGRIDAPIAIEVGLDYGLWHLEQDAHKLLHSAVPLPYLLHLSRLRVRDRDETERLLTAPTAPLRAAYVHVDPATGDRRVKHVGSSAVSLA